MSFNGIDRWSRAAVGGFALALALGAHVTAEARNDGGVDDLLREYRPVAYAKSALPLLPTPLCGGGEIGRPPAFIAGDGAGAFGWIVRQSGDPIESLLRLDRGGDCLTPLELSLPMEAALKQGGTCTLTTTQDLVGLPEQGVLLHSLSGLDATTAGCFVTYRVDLASGQRAPVLDSSVVKAPVPSFNPSPWSVDIPDPVFITIDRLATVVPDGSFAVTDILRTGDVVATDACPTATVAEFRARPAVSGSRILASAEFDESSCQAGVRTRTLLVAYDEAGDSWTARAVDAREPGTGDAVQPGTLVGHPAIETFLTNGVNQETAHAGLYRFEVDAEGKTVAALAIEDLNADVGSEPALLPSFSSIVPGYTASGQPLMLGVGECRRRYVETVGNCLVAIGPAPGSDGAQQRDRLARIVGWGDDVPGYAPGEFADALFAATSGANVLVNFALYDGGVDYRGRSFHQLTLDSYRPSVLAAGKLRFTRALADGGLRTEQVEPLAGDPLINGIDVAPTARGVVSAGHDGEGVLAALRESSVLADVYGEDGQLRRNLSFPKRIDSRALFRLGDVDGSGADEVAVAGFHDDGRTVVTVRDSRDGELLASWAFTAKYRPEFAALTDDVNGNGAEEIAILGVNLDGSVRAEVRDGLTGESLSLVVLGRALRPVGFVAVPDREGRRVWLSMLGTRDDGKTTAVTFEAGDGARVSKTWFSRTHVPVAFGAYGGFGPEDGAALVVVGIGVNGQPKVMIRNVVTGAKLAVFRLPRRYTPFDVTEVQDYRGDGTNDLLFVGSDLAGDIRLIVTDPASGQKVRAFSAD
jgi:hypothetical protein